MNAMLIVTAGRAGGIHKVQSGGVDDCIALGDKDLVAISVYVFAWEPN
jgi:hypothetical protein